MDAAIMVSISLGDTDATPHLEIGDFNDDAQIDVVDVASHINLIMSY